MLNSAGIPLPDRQSSSQRVLALRRNLSEREIPGLHGFRGLAALSVVAYHGISPYFPGPNAVAAFFVLSGFLITWILLSEQDRNGSISLGRFWIRRSLRILPPFWAFWLVQMLTYGAATGAAVSSFFYVFNYWQLAGHGIRGPFGHTWSLAVEEQFYLIWPIVFPLLGNSIRVIRWLVAGAVFIQVARALLLWNGVPFNYPYASFELRADGLMVGCAAAMYLHGGFHVPSILLHPAWSVPAVVLLVVSGWGSDPIYASTAVGAAVATWTSVLLILQAVSNRPRWLDNPAMRSLGLISYALYLYHPLMHHVVDQFGLKLRYAAPLRMLLPVLAASLSYLLIERPALRLKDRITSRRPGPSVAA